MALRCAGTAPVTVKDTVKRIVKGEVFMYCLTFYMSQSITKPTKWQMHPAKTKISLGIRPVWSECSLSAWRKLGSLATHWPHSEDSDQTGGMIRLIWVFTGRTGHFLGFVVRSLILNKGSPCDALIIKLDMSHITRQENLSSEFATQ